MLVLEGRGMPKSERVGYVIEHLLAKALEIKGYEVRRNTTPYEGAIKSDLIFVLNGTDVVVLCTHTRSTGMTNRKFYRSFAELAERRTRSANTIVIDCVLLSSLSHVRPGYAEIFNGAFDGCVSIYDEMSMYHDFMVTIEERMPSSNLDDNYIDTLLEKLGEAHRKAFCNAADSIINLLSCINAPFAKFWEAESDVTPGNVLVSRDHMADNVKLALKALMVCPEWALNDPYFEEGLIERKPQFSREEIIKFKATDVFSDMANRLGRGVARVSKNAASGFALLRSIGIDPISDWWVPYASTKQGKEMVRLLRSEKSLLDIYNNAVVNISDCDDRVKLQKYFLHIYKSSGSSYCHEIDLCLRAAGLSQNELAIALSNDLNISGRGFPPPDMLIRSVLAKKSFPDSAGTIENYFMCLAGYIFPYIEKIKSLSTEDLLEERCKEFLSHPFINPERVLLEIPLGKPIRGTVRRISVLPAFIPTDSRIPMAVDFDYVAELPNGKLWVKCISSYEKRHHKHKEFSGKLRAVRNATTSEINQFLAIIEGEWTDQQINMLNNAGWNVCTWDMVGQFKEALLK
jgi:hypothetical protein